MLTIVAERAETRRSLRALEGYHIAVQRDQEMLATFGDRVLAPLAKSFKGDGEAPKLAEAFRRIELTR